MGNLVSRMGIVFANMVILIPVFAVLLASAIMSSIAAVKINKLQDQSDSVKKAYKFTTGSTITLWILSVGSLVFSFTIGLFIIPWLVGIPYLYGAVMFIFAIINLVMAGIFFYNTNAIRKSIDYKNAEENAKSAFKYCLSIGLMMLFAALFMIGYAIWSVYKYHKGGGLAGDINIALEVAPLLIPGVGEVAVGSEVLGGIAKGTSVLSKVPQLAKAFGAQAEDIGRIFQVGQQLGLGGKKPTQPTQ